MEKNTTEFELSISCTIVLDTIDKRNKFCSRKIFDRPSSFCRIRKMLDGYQIMTGDNITNQIFVTSTLNLIKGDGIVSFSIPSFRTNFTLVNCNDDDILSLSEFTKEDINLYLNDENRSCNNILNSNQSHTRKPLTPMKTGCTPNKKKAKQNDITIDSKENKLATLITEDQRSIIESCVDGENVFYTGGAGCGKSYLLKKIVEAMIKVFDRSEIFITATTGLAACSIGGTTIHQFAGLRSGDEFQSIEKVKMFQQNKFSRRWTKAKVLIVDEISMMSPEILEMLNTIAQKARNNLQPMGGIQVIFTGDFFQLPPVYVWTSKKNVLPFKLQDTQQLNFKQVCTQKENKCDKRFCFQSPVWSELFSKAFILKEVFRQEDVGFSSLLNDIRIGEFSASSLAILNQCVGRTLDCENGILPTRIYTHREDVDNLNNVELNKLTGKRHVFDAFDSGDSGYIRAIQSSCPAKQQITLIVGAQVILLKSIDASQGLVNGSKGVVVDFATVSQKPVVRFQNGVERIIGAEVFSLCFGGSVIAQRSQIPLDLAWGISVHKSQGMTVEKAIIDIRKTFEYGQAYVALSRVKSLEGLSLSFPISGDKIKVHRDVQNFYASIQQQES